MGRKLENQLLNYKHKGSSASSASSVVKAFVFTVVLTWRPS